MSAYNPPTETLPRFNTTAFIQNANVTYPVAQGALTIPKQIRIIDGSNTIIITPTSIIINGIVYSLTNIAYLNLSQTFTGVNSFSNTLKANVLQGLTTTDNISLYDTSTNEISIGSGNAGNINIGSSASNISLKGVNTFINGFTLTNTLKSINSTSSISLYEVPMTSLSMGHSNAPITITGLTNTINGNTTIVNTLLANTLTGKLTTDIISLYDTTTADISIGSNSTGSVNIGSPSSTNISLKGVNTTINGFTLTNTLKSINSSSSVSLYEVPMISLSMGNSASPNTITGYTNTINGDTILTNTLKVNAVVGKIVTDAISLYDTSTGIIKLGNSTLGTNTNTIYGITTFNQSLNAPTPSTLINTSQVPTTAYLTTFYAPLTGTIANATAITLTPNTTDTTGYVTFSSTASGSSNIKTNTALLYNASTGNLSSTIYTSNALRGQTVSSAISLYTTNTSGGITLGNTSNTNTINGNTTMTNILSLTSIRGVTITAGVFLFDNMTTGSINIGGASHTGTINIGNTSSSSVAVNGVLSVFTNMSCNTIKGIAAANAISLYDTSTGTITFGNSTLATNTNNIYGITTFNQAISAPTPASLLNTTRVPTTAYLTTFYAPLTGTIANATAITLTPNTTDTLGYITFSSTASGSSNIKTNTNLTFNASTGKLTASSLETNTIQGVATGSNVALYNNVTTGTISIGGANTADINIGSSSGATSLKSSITYINGTANCNDIQPNNSSSNVTLYTSPMASLTIGNNTTSTTTIKGLTNSIFGDTSIINTLKGNTIQGILTTDAVLLYTLTTGGITLGNSSGTNTINGNTTITNTLRSNTIRGVLTTDNISLYSASTGTITLGNGTVSTNTITGNSNTITGLANTITGLANTINGVTTIVDTLDVNTVEGKAVTDAISLYATSTSGGITLGNTANTNTINGNTTMTNTLIVNTVHSIASGTTMNLCNNLTTGNIIVGSNLTSGVITIGRTAQTGNVTINGGLTGGTNSLFNNSTTSAVNIYTARTTGVLTIGSSSTTAVNTNTNIHGTSVTGGVNNLFTNTRTANSNILTGVTTGQINIGTGLIATGTVTIGSSLGTNTINGVTTITNTLDANTIEGTTTSSAINLYNNVTTGVVNFLTNSLSGVLSILTSNTDSDLNIGNSANTGNLNFKWGFMYFTSGYFNFNGFFTVQRNASSLIYAPYAVETYTSTGNQASPYGKFLHCNYSVASQTMFLRAPDSQMEGMEFVIRFTNTAGSVAVLGLPTVFRNTANANVTSLSGSNVIRVICLSVSSVYYWVQL